MTENIFIGIFRLRGHQGMGKNLRMLQILRKSVIMRHPIAQVGSQESAVNVPRAGEKPGVGI